MDTKRILKYTGLGIILVIFTAFGVMGFIFYDVNSYTATGSEKLNPSRASVGKALVVYDPGISGQAKDAAELIAKNLQETGYIIDLGGISNVEAKNTSGYNIIIVGGPVYAGKASASVQSYLNTLKPPKNAKIAVFATGQDADILKNPEMLKKEVAPLPEGNSLQIVAVTKFIEGDTPSIKSAQFVDSILNVK